MLKSSSAVALRHAALSDLTEQQLEAADTVAGLLGVLLQLLAQLPKLAEASGEPLSPRFVLEAAEEAAALLAYR